MSADHAGVAAPAGIGAPRSRADGPDKVTGRARYAAEAPVAGLVHGALVGSTVARGSIRELRIAAAAGAPGVLRVITHLDAPRLRPLRNLPTGQALMPLQDSRIHYEGQPIALVVAETLEQALGAAALAGADYDAEPPAVDFRAALDQAFPGEGFAENDTTTGDFAAAVAAAPVVVERTYRTADRHHNPMEPSATIAAWNGDNLEVHDATQYVWGVRMTLAAAFGIPQEAIRVRCSYTGGGFGSKGFVWPHQVLCAMAARVVGRPVRLVLTRAQTFTAHGYQAASEQRLTLAAGRDGRLAGIRHESVTPTSSFEGYVEYCAAATRTLYACPAIETRHRVVHVDRGTPTPMRAPHEGPGMVGLECAMDELAAELDMDPVELRLRNHAERDPTTGKPFSSKALAECYRQGAERFGWDRRPRRPRSLRDGGVLVGWGMASAIMTTFRFAASARVTLAADGGVLVEAGTQEIGTGVYTILPQIAAAALGVSAERARLVLGDTDLPETGGTFGSSTTIGVGSAVHVAATRLRQRLDELAGGPGRADPTCYTTLLARHGLGQATADAKWDPAAGSSPLGEPADWSMHTFGAVFVEVRVDEELPLPRVSRCLGVYSAGRIINPKTARSQMTGAMVWGIGQALLERSEMDRVLGRYLSKNLAGYLLPVNADVPDLEAHFVDEVDPHASALGAKGIGELGAVGVGPAIANAVHHATGIRVRSLPILPEDLMA